MPYWTENVFFARSGRSRLPRLIMYSWHWICLQSIRPFEDTRFFNSTLVELLKEK